MPPARLVGVVLAVLTSTACEDLPRNTRLDAGSQGDVGRQVDAGRGGAGGAMPAIGGTGGAGGMQPREPDAGIDAPTPDAAVDQSVDSMIDQAQGIDSPPPPPPAALWDDATWDLSVWGP